MPDFISNYAGNRMLAYLLHGTFYLALHVSDPTLVGLLASELAGGGYQRQKITFTIGSGKVAVSNNNQVFAGLVPETVAFFGIWDAIAAGNLTWAIDLTVPPYNPIPVTESGELLAYAGDFALSL